MKRTLCKEVAELNEGSFHLKGRIVSRRNLGKIIFMTLKDGSGQTQISLKQDTLMEKYDSSKKQLRIGDIIELDGNLFMSQSGEKTIDIIDYNVHSKCNQKFPDKRRGLDRRKSFDHRGLDILTDQTSFDRFTNINNIVKEIRMFLYNKGFQEVDTGILKKVTDTSAAKEFTTYSHHLKRDLYLRKSMEMRLKQLLVGGMENIFEMGKDFRNESISSEFHPEFTAIELYQSYANYLDILDIVKNMLNHLDSTIGEPFSKPSQAEEVKLYDFILENTGLDVRNCDLSEIRKKISPNRLKNYEDLLEFRGFYVYDLFLSILDNFSNKNIILHGVPKEISVLGKTLEDEPSLVEEFRYFVGGRSFCYGMTELTDAQEQQSRLESQSRYLGKSMENHDDSFLEVLKFGLPPCAGLGLGLERLLMIYTNQESIKDVIYFPL